MCALQTLIRKKTVQYRETSLFKACKNLLLSQAPPPLKPAAASASASASLGGGIGLMEKEEAAGISSWFKRYENPCLDLYFNVMPPEQQPVSRAHLHRLLPPAWSHNPLTTLKIIRTLPTETCYAKALYWLHQKHPKTLTFNLPYLVSGGYRDFPTIIYGVLGLEEMEPIPGYYSLFDHVIDELQVSIQTQPDLHDRISGFFAEGLKFDIQNLINSSRHGVDAIMEVTDASKFCNDVPFLLESIAERLFPASASVEEAVERLKEEVLEPLSKVLHNTDGDQYEMNPWGYRCVHDDTKDPYFLWNKYLKEAKESSDKMVANALLPDQIVLFVDNEDLRQVVELQWKMMVEDLKKKNHKEILSHSLVVIHPNKNITSLNGCHALAMSLTILVSELSAEEEWKGKFIPLVPRPRLVSIQGDDLKSKCRFLREGVVQNQEEYTDFKSVFDLILQEAVDRSLKPDQMIKRLYVLTEESCFARISSDDDRGMQSNWQVGDYEDMKSKYKEHGYDIPHIVFWRIGHSLEPVKHSPDERGIITMTGFNMSDNYAAANFVNMFLENDGEMSPQHIMETNLAHQDYDQSLLAVLD